MHSTPRFLTDVPRPVFNGLVIPSTAPASALLDRVHSVQGSTIESTSGSGITMQPNIAPLAATATRPASARDGWEITKEDKKSYAVHFATADEDGDGYVDGAEAQKFFSLSGLEPALLGQIWILSDRDQDNRFVS